MLTKLTPAFGIEMTKIHCFKDYGDRIDVLLERREGWVNVTGDEVEPLREALKHYAYK